MSQVLLLLSYFGHVREVSRLLILLMLHAVWAWENILLWHLLGLSGEFITVTINYHIFSIASHLPLHCLHFSPCIKKLFEKEQYVVTAYVVPLFYHAISYTFSLMMVVELGRQSGYVWVTQQGGFLYINNSRLIV